jgi:hypothetical protein
MRTSWTKSYLSVSKISLLFHLKLLSRLSSCSPSYHERFPLSSPNHPSFHPSDRLQMPIIHSPLFLLDSKTHGCHQHLYWVISEPNPVWGRIRVPPNGSRLWAMEGLKGKDLLCYVTSFVGCVIPVSLLVYLFRSINVSFHDLVSHYKQQEKGRKETQHRTQGTIACQSFGSGGTYFWKEYWESYESFDKWLDGSNRYSYDDRWWGTVWRRVSMMYAKAAWC